MRVDINHPEAVSGFQIGNYVFDKDDKTDLNYYKLVKIECPEYSEWNGSDDEFVGMFDGSRYGVNPIGIELLEGVLLRFGFEKIDHYRFKIKPNKESEYYYTYSIHDYAFRFYLGESITYITSIYFLHQLQNIYSLIFKESLNELH